MLYPPNKIYKVFRKQKNKTASYLIYFLLILKKPNQEIYQKQPLKHKDNKYFICPIASSSMLWLMQHSFQISSFFCFCVTSIFLPHCFNNVSSFFCPFPVVKLQCKIRINFPEFVSLVVRQIHFVLVLYHC